MKKRTVITTEKREVWVVREVADANRPVDVSDAIEIGSVEAPEEKDPERLEKEQRKGLSQ